MCIKLLSPMSIETLMYCYESGRPSGKALLPKLSTQPYIAIKAISIMTIFKNIYDWENVNRWEHRPPKGAITLYFLNYMI